MAKQGRYLYAVCRGLTPEAVDGIVGLGGGRISLVAEGEVVGLVSPVDLDEYGEEGLRRNLERLDWLEEAARGHDAVVVTSAEVSTMARVRAARGGGGYGDPFRARPTLDAVWTNFVGILAWRRRWRWSSCVGRGSWSRAVRSRCT